MTPRWTRRKRLDDLRVARGMVRATLNPIIGHVGSTGRSEGNHEHLTITPLRTVAYDREAGILTDSSPGIATGVWGAPHIASVADWNRRPRTEHP